jgi:hypothetical protein
MSTILGIFVFLHGLVHFWYVTLSQGWVEYQADMGWTGQSWLLSGFVPSGARGLAATIFYALAGIAFAASGIGLLSQAEWTRPLLVASAGVSSAVILVFWDGNTQLLVQKGLIGLLINLVIIGVSLASR